MERPENYFLKKSAKAFAVCLRFADFFFARESICAAPIVQARFQTSLLQVSDSGLQKTRGIVSSKFRLSKF